MSVRLRTAASIRSSTAKRWRTASPHAGSNTRSWEGNWAGAPTMRRATKTGKSAMIGYAKPDRSKEESSDPAGYDRTPRGAHVFGKRTAECTVLCSWRKRSGAWHGRRTHPGRNGELETHAAVMTGCWPCMKTPGRKTCSGTATNASRGR